MRQIDLESQTSCSGSHPVPLPRNALIPQVKNTSTAPCTGLTSSNGTHRETKNLSRSPACTYMLCMFASSYLTRAYMFFRTMAAAARDELQKEWQSTKPLLKALTNSLDFLCDATNIELLSDAQSIDVVTTTLIQLRLKATTALSNLADTTEGLVAAVTKFHIVEKVLDDTNKDIANAIVDKLAAGITFT